MERVPSAVLSAAADVLGAVPGTPALQRARVEEARSLLSQVSRFQARLLSRLGGPEGLADQFTSMLESDELPVTYKAKLLESIVNLMKASEDKKGEADLGLLTVEELEEADRDLRESARERGTATSA